LVGCIDGAFTSALGGHLTFTGALVGAPVRDIVLLGCLVGLLDGLLEGDAPNPGPGAGAFDRVKDTDDVVPGVPLAADLQ
jgi:hypothetical protein